MLKIVNWLQDIEQQAGQLYTDSAQFFAEDPILRAFLEDMAADEEYHYQVMIRAVEYLSKGETFSEPLEIDEKFKKETEEILSHGRKNLDNGTLTKDHLIESIISIEYAEWNKIFLSVVKCLAESSRDFIKAVSNMQHHTKHIELFLESSPQYKKHLDTIKKLPRTWEEKILIVEDEPIVSSLLKIVLEKDGAIDIAENGEKGLEKVQNNYYRLIISDVNMPVMNGIRFFQQATEQYPTLKERFLFYTGNLTVDEQNFISDNQLNLMYKPTAISEIRHKAMEILIQREMHF
ncbi:response regulator [Thermodesulfobacteriota bacterium]